jgi:hypothetical protein
MPDGKFLIEYKRIQLMPGLRHLVSYNPKPSKDNSAFLFGYPNYNYDLKELYGGSVSLDTLANVEVPPVEDIKGLYIE